MTEITHYGEGGIPQVVTWQRGPLKFEYDLSTGDPTVTLLPGWEHTNWEDEMSDYNIIVPALQVLAHEHPNEEGVNAAFEQQYGLGLGEVEEILVDFLLHVNETELRWYRERIRKVRGG